MAEEQVAGAPVSEAGQLLAVTKEILAEYKATTELTVGMSRVVRDNYEVVKDIHILVNSEKTAALERELRSAKRELILLRELGRPESVIAETQKVVDELEETLKEREAAQEKVNQQNS